MKSVIPKCRMMTGAQEAVRVVWDGYERSCEPVPAGHTHLGLESGE